MVIGSQGHRKHLFRAAGLLLGALFIFFVVRALLVPGSFGQYGHFRGDNLAEQAAKPMIHGSPVSCADCHDELFQIKMAGKHAAVPCQDCHAPLAHHIKDDGIEPMPIHKSYTLCIRCHLKIESRPKNFPQIDLHEHLAKANLTTDDEGVCFTCHKPHDPLGKK